MYAFGKMDAGVLVRAAKTWINVGPQITYYSLTKSVGKQMPHTPVSSSVLVDVIEVTAADTKIKSLEHVQVSVSLTTTRRGGIVLELACPSGTLSTLVRFFSSVLILLIL